MKTTHLLAAAALSAAASTTVLAESATVTIGSVGAEPGQTVRVPIDLTTEDLVGAFDFFLDSSGLTVSDVDYVGLLFSNGWTGWDTAPTIDAQVTGACIFPQDQVSGVNLRLVDLLVDVPADAAPGSEIEIDMSSVFVTDYSFVPYDVTLIPGTIVVTSAACDEDVNGDGQVNFTDLVSILAAWGTCAGCDADVDGDGSVGLSDLLMVLAGWGACD